MGWHVAKECKRDGSWPIDRDCYSLRGNVLFDFGTEKLDGFGTKEEAEKLIKMNTKTKRR